MLNKTTQNTKHYIYPRAIDQVSKSIVPVIDSR